MTARPLLLGLVALAGASCAARGHLAGVVVDPEGRPLPRAQVTITPGETTRLTDQAGRFTLDGLDDAARGRTRPLRRQTAYALEVFKPGYHLQHVSLFYTRGPVELPPVQLLGETMAVHGDALRTELGLVAPVTHPAGAAYEGQ